MSKKIIVHPTSTSEWYGLVKEACKACSITLHEELESYLVFLLMRFTTSTEIANKIIATDFLDSHLKPLTQKQQSFREIGDSCLIFSGLFPERAKHRRVNVDYYINIGQSAYDNLAKYDHDTLSKLFAKLCLKFIHLTEILQNMRDVDSNPIFAEINEYWNKSNFQMSDQIITNNTKH